MRRPNPGVTISARTPVMGIDIKYMVRLICHAENKAHVSQCPGAMVLINRSRLLFRILIGRGLHSIVILINSLLDHVLNVTV